MSRRHREMHPRHQAEDLMEEDEIPQNEMPPPPDRLGNRHRWASAVLSRRPNLTSSPSAPNVTNIDAVLFSEGGNLEGRRASLPAPLIPPIHPPSYSRSATPATYQSFPPPFLPPEPAPTLDLNTVFASAARRASIAVSSLCGRSGSPDHTPPSRPTSPPPPIPPRHTRPPFPLRSRLASLFSPLTPDPPPPYSPPANPIPCINCRNEIRCTEDAYVGLPCGHGLCIICYRFYNLEWTQWARGEGIRCCGAEVPVYRI